MGVLVVHYCTWVSGETRRREAKAKLKQQGKGLPVIAYKFDEDVAVGTELKVYKEHSLESPHIGDIYRSKPAATAFGKAPVAHAVHVERVSSDGVWLKLAPTFFKKDVETIPFKKVMDFNVEKEGWIEAKHFVKV